MRVGLAKNALHHLTVGIVAERRRKIFKSQSYTTSNEERNKCWAITHILIVCRLINDRIQNSWIMNPLPRFIGRLLEERESLRMTNDRILNPESPTQIPQLPSRTSWMPRERWPHMKTSQSARASSSSGTAWARRWPDRTPEINLHFKISLPHSLCPSLSFGPYLWLYLHISLFLSLIYTNTHSTFSKLSCHRWKW